MTREEARRYIKSQLEGYLSSRGINTRKPFRCLNPAHDDHTPSMSFDKKRDKAHCFSCGADYDTFDLIGIDYGLTDDSDVFRKAYDVFGIDMGGRGMKGASTTKRHEDVHEETTQDYTDFFRKAHERISETDYPKRRGLSQDVIDRFNLGYVPEWRHPKAPGAVSASPRLIIPTGKGSYVARDTRDSLTDQERRYAKSKVGRVHIFNAQALTGAKGPVFVVEGELDALSVVEAGGEAVALGSASMINQFAAIVEDRKPTVPLMLSLDNDGPGQAATDELVQKLQLIPGISFYRHNVAGDRKDANEALLADRGAFAAAVAGAADIERDGQADAKAAYSQTSAANYLQSFIDGIAASVDTRFIPTGFDRLDEFLDGGLTEGLYVLGAISSIGKTTFALQIADCVAAQGHDALIFSLEMSMFELMAKSISRLTLLQSLQQKQSGNTRDAKTARGITTGARYGRYSKAELELIDSATGLYKGYAGHIFISEGIGDIGAAQARGAVERHISLTGNRPVVIVDYLQILAPHSERMTDKQNTDRAVLELKRISRDFKIPVIGISSFNRQNYKSPVTMESFKESGAIEYSSDVLLGLQLKGAGKNLDVNAAKSKNPRDVELVILKNRNGPTGKRIAYEYYPMFNYFEETSDAGPIADEPDIGGERE
jgi:replicative DNA helicase